MGVSCRGAKKLISRIEPAETTQDSGTRHCGYQDAAACSFACDTLANHELRGKLPTGMALEIGAGGIGTANRQRTSDREAFWSLANALALTLHASLAS